MKNTIFLSILLLSTSVFAGQKLITANNTVSNNNLTIDQLMAQYLKPKAYVNTSYDDFKFSSRNGVLFNQYRGHTNTVAVGFDNINFNNYFAGFNFYNLSTRNTAWAQLDANLSQNFTSIANNGVYGHVMKQVYAPLFIDVFASYGQNIFKLNSTIYGNNLGSVEGLSRYSGNNGIIGARTFFGYAYQDLYLQGDVTYFYGNFYQRSYHLIFPSQSLLNTQVPSLRTKIGTLVENARLYYRINDHLSPFVAGGLIQLTSRTFSRPVVDPNLALVSPLPQLLVGKTGYRYGAGLNFDYKFITIMPVYLHTNRGHTYSDDYVGVTIEIKGL